VNKSESEHLEKIRARFTRTAEPFADFVLTRRSGEAESAAEAAIAGFANAARAVAVDLACGPGTFVRALAPRVARAIGVDLTPAMLARARQEAARAGAANLEFACADAGALPFADASLDIALCGYALHHLLEPFQVIREMARVVRPGGRVAVVDLIVPEDADSDAYNHVERVRDASHVTTRRAAELQRMFQGAHLRELSAEQHRRQRDFNDWMRVAGHDPGSAIYEEIRGLMESSTNGDTTGYAARVDPVTGDWQFTQVTLFLLAEKL
jgi:ubiquinone/menaquinone biosynthesis C-methylase UbiE